jgi:hypothetical protein
MDQKPEVWLRGPVDGVPPLLQPVAHALIQSREEVRTAVSDLTDDEIWLRPGSAAAIERSATDTAQSSNISALAAVSRLCDNPFAAGRSFSTYDPRLGPEIPEYDVYDAYMDAPSSSTIKYEPAPNYRDYALEDPSDDDVIKAQLANIESDINEVKLTIENMVSDISDIAHDSKDTSVTIKTVEAHCNDITELICELRSEFDSEISKINNKLDQILAMLSK